MPDTTQVVPRRCAHCGTVAKPGIAFCGQCGASLEVRADGDALQDALRALFGRELEIEREIGRGGMAAVFSAFDPELHRRVAVKVLLPEVAESADIAERFRREARTVAALQHPNIVSVYSVRSDGAMSAIVMQYVEGRSLDAALTGDVRLPPQVAGLILAQVSEALQHAHDRGVVHRDVKPANVLLDHAGHAVVSDFGIARREGGTRLTDTGVVMGTVAYMSPEQCLGGAVTPASDQYSFGIMAYELLAGRRPFSDGTVIEMLRAHVDDPPPDLATIATGISPAVAAYVMRALRKDPGERHQDLRGAAQVFGSLVGDQKSTTQIIGTLAKPAPAVPTMRAGERMAVMASEPTKLIGPTARPRRTPLIAAAAIVLVAVPVAWWTLARGSGGAPDASHSAVPVQSGAAAATAPATGAAGTDAAASRQSPKPGTTAGAVTGALAGAPVNPPASGKSPPSSPAVSAESSVTRLAPPPPAAQSAQPAAAQSAQSAPPASPSAGPAPPSVSATLADARAVAREFIAISNQRRARDLEQLGSLDGDPALRAELLRRIAAAPDFAAGFDRVASSPTVAGDRFTTDFVIDAEWRGGQLTATVKLQAAQQNGAWHVTAFGVSPAP